MGGGHPYGFLHHVLHRSMYTKIASQMVTRYCECPHGPHHARRTVPSVILDEVVYALLVLCGVPRADELSYWSERVRLGTTVKYTASTDPAVTHVLARHVVTAVRGWVAIRRPRLG